MKKQFGILGLVLLSLGLIAFNFYQWQNHQTLKQEKEKLEQQRVLLQVEQEKKEQALKEITLQKKREKEEKRYLERLAELKANSLPEARTLPEGGVVSEENQTSQKSQRTNDNPFAQLLAQPEMKEMVRNQQKVMAQQIYRDFFKQASFSPEEKEKFMKLIEEKNMQDFDEMQKVMGGQKEAIATEFSGEAKLKELLGESRYTQYETYQKTVGERMVVNGYSDQMASSEAPLQPYQREQLTQILIEEYKHNPLNEMSDNEAFNVMSQSAKTRDDYFSAQKKLNEQILIRAQTVLNPNQLESFKQYQNNMLMMAETSMKMIQPRSNKP